jgi:hypothetical protein
MREYFGKSKTDKRQFAEVRMRWEVLEGVEKLAEEPECFIFIFLCTRRTSAAADLNTTLEGTANKTFGSIPWTGFVRDIILHASVRINLQFTWIHRGTEAWIVSSSIFAFTVTLGIVY